MDTDVYFQPLDRPDRVEGIAQLLLRRGRLEPHVLVLCPDEAFARALDARLWTVSQESFLAHGVDAGDAAENAEQPILLATRICRDNAPAVLVNGGEELPPDLSGFATIVDFVDGWDEGLKARARERFRTYRQLGMEPAYLGAGRGGRRA